MTTFKQCPGCQATFDMFAEGQMAFGQDSQGLYMEHVPCGYRGRLDPDATNPESQTFAMIVPEEPPPDGL